jgi:hypothetical protein
VDPAGCAACEGVWYLSECEVCESVADCAPRTRECNDDKRSCWIERHEAFNVRCGYVVVAGIRKWREEGGETYEPPNSTRDVTLSASTRAQALTGQAIRD